MNFLLDTNVVSEWVKQQPNPGVVDWLAEVDEDRTFLRIVTIAELRHGIQRLDDGRRRRRLDAWLRDELTVRFEARIIPIDLPVADTWGDLVARREAAGRPIRAMDAFIAATANVHALALVTRNVSDFESSVGDLVNPWL